MLLNYTCECLDDSYYGRHCESTAKRIVIFRVISKSFSHIAIIVLTMVIMFFIIMDVLKYCFSIDVTREQLERFRQEKQRKKRKTSLIKRIVYVNAVLPQMSN